ncbi:hypothetical protein [Alishewanella longhuensis]
MFNFTPEDHQKIIKLFEFLDSETPAAKAWIRNYLVRKGLNSPQETWAAQSSQLYAVDQIISCLSNFSEIKLVANQMSNAWRGRKHRQNKNLVNLSVGLDKAVSIKLSEMSKGLTQAEIITQLIEGNYPTFLADKREQERIRADEKAAAKRLKNTNLIKKMMGQTHSESSLVAKQINAAKDLKDVMLMIEEIARELTMNDNNQEKPLSTKE